MTRRAHLPKFKFLCVPGSLLDRCAQPSRGGFVCVVPFLGTKHSSKGTLKEYLLSIKNVYLSIGNLKPTAEVPFSQPLSP